MIGSQMRLVSDSISSCARLRLQSAVWFAAEIRKVVAKLAHKLGTTQVVAVAPLVSLKLVSLEHMNV